MRPLDVLRSHILDNVLTEHYAATMRQEDRFPFTSLDKKILVVRQGPGPADDDVVKNHCECFVYSEAGANQDQEQETAEYAERAHNYILDNFKSGSIFGMSSVESPNGPFFTGQDRYYYKFTIRTLTHT